ncbi:hypothetical protein P1X15_02825 [Runella sp. MFBS21]|uniref:hypothetical protein n=1 Tax=Runella sp. MFBS21 TaxID=3034018 RepID=UPI0023F6B223|nr:hypothetical protein [Runella sp. MFBS21]MDF7816505.1 hypothetical protein [Runella sp. MFBS21]
MNRYLLLSLFLASLAAQSQIYVRPDGEYMDTTLVLGKNCFDTKGESYYYSYDAKYPRSSTTIQTNASSFLNQRNIKLTENGYVTFRFRVNCSGEISYVKLMQTDENYQPKKFKVETIQSLYEFTKSLKDWKLVKYKNIIPLSYTAFISYKIHHGQIVAVIP